MPRIARVAPGGYVLHVTNRGNRRMPIFASDEDYAAFERVVRETLEKVPTRILAWRLMPNHWHFVLWPREEGEIGRFMQRLTVTHVRRWHENRKTVGLGHLYQGTYKSFLVQEDGHFLTVCRYVERNGLRAGFVSLADQWRWGSGWIRSNGTPPLRAMLSEWPLEMPSDFGEWVNRPQNLSEVEGIRESVRRGRPFGDEVWTQQMADRFDLGFTLRPRGRPRSA